jgi:hypothetical protein
MSLIDEYNSSSSELHGFTLGFCTFFAGFTTEYKYSIGGKGDDPNTFCWNKRILSIWNYGHLVDFVREQLIWIYSEEIQKEAKTNPRKLREECQKRINFFVLKLQEKIGSGYDGKAHFYLRDIRNSAFLSLKT